MLWFEAHCDLPRHPKLKRLARNLGCSRQAAIGYLYLLWAWAMQYAPTGQIIPPYSAEDVSDAVEWEGEPADFLDAAVKAGFLDCSEEVVRVHDWRDYAGKLLEKREQDRVRKEKKRKTKSGA